MFAVCERGSSERGRGINESGLYWIIKTELLAAYIIFSHVPVPSGDLQKFTCLFRNTFIFHDLSWTWCIPVGHLSVVNGRSIICQEASWAAIVFFHGGKIQMGNNLERAFFTEWKPELLESRVEELRTWVFAFLSCTWITRLFFPFKLVTCIL